MTLADLRKDYSLAGLAEKDLARNPFRQFEKWFEEALAAKLPEPNAMVLSTADRSGRPSSRTVLLRGVDGRGFVFYTNYEGRKGRELEVNPRASLVFPWIAMERQVIVRGPLGEGAARGKRRLFLSRPRPNQLSAWVSQQSAIISGRAVLEDGMKAVEMKYSGREVPRPPHWGGYRLDPETVEFWQGRRSRLHDRLRFRRAKGGDWTVERLAP